MWLPELDHGRPAYLAIADDIARAIRRGTLRPGDRLPTHRLLADLLGVNVSTVTRAYREAARRRLIDGETGRGTFVLGRSAEAALFAYNGDPARDLIDLSTNTPPRAPRDSELAATISAFSSGESASLLHYHTTGDWLVHRATAARWLGLRGIDVDPAAIVVCAGAQHAMETALSLFEGADAVATEALVYPGLKAIARQRRLTLEPLAMDGEGVTPAAVEAACRHAGGRVVVLSPTLQNPTTASMGLARREQIVSIARRYDTLIVEEDVYGLLPATPSAPLAALAPERVCYVTGLSKTVAPGLRIGYLVLPPRLRNRMDEAEHRTSWYVSPISATIAAHWMHGGTALDRLARQRTELAARHRIVCERLAAFKWHGGAHCPHVWLEIGRRNADEFAERARARGVAVVPKSVFACGRQGGVEAVRISIGAAPNRKLLDRGLTLIAELLSEQA
ncbi:aminotransferase-like domain-containing protein [Cognatazoarcus halotolerans]|uniref:aminotransferase-like domain-containing protein n=1 Tax=Cognatazoarcus halotolerans TaxID=2686016 RepID=UPI001357C20C|nr:PLP-dependent aminotransferase family protein [Cognatazoarcus halotolerans]MCP5309110.1 PLP-dependent aminotransferase family protein [Zoogloeaceae bacterium]